MYAKLEEITLIHPSKYRPQEGDHPIYERGLNGDRVFTLDPEPSKYDSAPPKRYGLGYIGPNEDVCIVPDLWAENDSWIARNAVRPDWLIFDVGHPVERVVVADGSVYSADAAESAGWRPFDAIQVNGVMYARLPAKVLAGFATKPEDIPVEDGAVAMQDLGGQWWSVALAARQEA